MNKLVVDLSAKRVGLLKSVCERGVVIGKSWQRNYKGRVTIIA
jgi:hypothetical protein